MSNLDALRPTFVTGLRNAHAVENQALALIDRQLERLENYPALSERLTLHRTETENQIGRLEEILSSLAESHSSLKDMALSLSGNMAALGHTIAGDEVLKNSFANLAFENFECASYISLITLAEMGGFNSAVPLLQTSLSEEEAMATFVREAIPDTTERFVRLASAGAQASR